MLERIRLFEELEGAQRVLLCGAGGGFDIYAGIPLFSALRRRGCEVFLGNLSFTNLAAVGGRQAVPGMVEVTAASEGPSAYFPERSLARFLAAEGMSTRIFAFEKVGVRPLRMIYEHLVEHLQVDTVVLVDGGTDILMRGDEDGLGTPTEDMTSLAASRSLDVPRKVVASIGFGIDTFHGVRHTQFLENVAHLQRMGGYWGAFSVTPDMPEAQLFLRAVAHADGETVRPSIVNGSIASALEGHYGNHHRHPSRTGTSELWINPLMALYWTFDLAAVADANLYLDDLEGTEAMWDVSARIRAARGRFTPREGPTEIPS